MKPVLVAVLLGAAAVTPSASLSLAADLAVRPATLPEAPSPHWIVRLRALGIQSGGSNSITAAGLPVPGAAATVSRNLLPELDVSYFLTRNVAASVNATASAHKVIGAGSISGLNVLGRMTVLAPAVTLQYHFTDLESLFKPYLGIGGTVAVCVDQKDGALGNFKVQTTPGAVFQAGFDWMIGGNWGINIDIKKYILRPVATGRLGPVPVSGAIKSDPWLIGAGLAFRF